MADFYNDYLPYAQDASQRTGLDPRLILAQAALESGWGKHAPGNNMFGIKSHGQAGGNTLGTTEYGPNGAYRTADSFRAYENPGASFGGYADFMLANPRYKDTMGAQGLEAQAAALGKSGYATDPNYGATVLKIAQGFPGGGNAVDAVNQAAGAPAAPSMPPGALSFDAANQDGGGALSPQAQQAAPNSGVLFKGEQPNKLHGIGAMLANVGAAIAGISNPEQGNSLRGIAQGIEAQSHGKFQYQMGPNGQLLRINKDTNAVDSINIPDAQKETWTPHFSKDDNGNDVYKGRFNTRSGQFISATPNAPASPPIGGDPNLTGQDRYESLTQAEKTQVDAWRDGKGIQPSQYAMRDPKVRKMVDAANAVGVDMQRYGERQAMARELTKSTPGGAGGQLDSSAAMIGHVTDLADDYIKLKNTGGWGATPRNAVANAMTPAGSERDQLLKSISTHSMNFAGEVTKQLAGAPGGQEERQRRVGLVDQPNAAPATQAASLEAELSDAIAKRTATLARVKDVMGEGYIAKNPRFKKQEEDLELAKAKLKELRYGPAIKDDKSATPAAPPIPSGWKVY